jgi:hypothetical protein
MKYIGTIIVESLISDSVLNFVEIKARETAELADPLTDQPKQVTIITFEIGDDMASAVVEEISRNLKSGHWYADVAYEFDKYVIFPNKIFRFAPKETEKRQKAFDYAKSLGIPESQIDF